MLLSLASSAECGIHASFNVWKELHGRHENKDIDIACDCLMIMLVTAYHFLHCSKRSIACV